MSHQPVDAFGIATRVIDGYIFVYDCTEIYRLARNSPIESVRLADFDLSKMFWFTSLEQASVSAVLEHINRINAACAEDPIVLAPDGALLDGLHRLAKAVFEKRYVIPARRLAIEPTPIFVLPLNH